MKTWKLLQIVVTKLYSSVASGLLLTRHFNFSSVLHEDRRETLLTLCYIQNVTKYVEDIYVLHNVASGGLILCSCFVFLILI